jgi:transcriptional antiterminator NusG
MDTQLSGGYPREWFAVQVWSGREQQSATTLQARGYEVFLPRYREVRRWSDRMRTIERPLFSGYLFCRIDSHVVGKIVTAPGVIRIVGNGSAPTPVPADEVAAIQNLVESRLNAEPCVFLREGQRVCIEYGPLRGMQGVVMKVKSRYRLVVSISLLQRSVAVDIEPSWISVPYGGLLSVE